MSEITRRNAMKVAAAAMLAPNLAVEGAVSQSVHSLSKLERMFNYRPGKGLMITDSGPWIGVGQMKFYLYDPDTKQLIPVENDKNLTCDVLWKEIP